MLNFVADNARRVLFWSIGILSVCIILGYAYFEFHPLLLGPIVTITSPQNGAVVATPLVAVEGTAKNITAITLNGRPISIDEQGRFKEKESMPVGYAMLTLVAKDRFGRSTTKTLELWRNATTPALATSSVPSFISTTTPSAYGTTSKK